MTNTTTQIQGPWTKLGISETAYLMAYTQGYNSGYLTYKQKCGYKSGTSLRKAYDKGRRDSKRIY